MRLDPVLSLLPKCCCPITLVLKVKFEAGVVSSGLAAKPSSGEFNLCFRSRGQLWSLKKKQKPGLGAQEVAQQPEFDPWNPRGKRRGGPTFQSGSVTSAWFLYTPSPESNLRLVALQLKAGAAAWLGNTDLSA